MKYTEFLEYVASPESKINNILLKLGYNNSIKVQNKYGKLIIKSYDSFTSEEINKITSAIKKEIENTNIRKVDSKNLEITL